MSIAQSILDIVLEESRLNRLNRVKTIKLQIGAMAAVVAASLTFCWSLLTKDNIIASGAILDIETVPVVAKCSQCNILFEVQEYAFLCPQCKQPVLELVSGRELSVVSIEGETGDDDGRDQDSGSTKHSDGERTTG
ncbi:MAG: hydrogenase maturation nickel metallochaperone HypA [Syntrophobacteraceae bacterium]